MKIRTTYEPTPLPQRDYDWLAVDDDTYDGGDPVGHGATEAEAIEDLLNLIKDANSAFAALPERKA